MKKLYVLSCSCLLARVLLAASNYTWPRTPVTGRGTNPRGLRSLSCEARGKGEQLV